jgi:hypothetical protein
VIVISYVIVRVFHLSSWGGPPLFREPAELQSPMEVSTLPAPLFTTITDYTVMVLRSNSNSFVMDTAPRGEGLGSNRRGGRVICQQFCLLSAGGNTLLESAGSGVWVGTSLSQQTVLILLVMVAPLQSVPGVSPPRGLIAGS